MIYDITGIEVAEDLFWTLRWYLKITSDLGLAHNLSDLSLAVGSNYIYLSHLIAVIIYWYIYRLVVILLLNNVIYNQK